MSSKDTVETDSLFLGLTRQPTVFGATFTFFALNTLGSIVLFLITPKFKIFIVTLIMHFIGVVWTKKEPFFVEIFINKLQRCKMTKNSKYHKGLNSYDIF